MCSWRAMKFIAVLAFAGIFALGFTTPGFAQTFGQKLGAQPSQSSGDLATNSAGQPKPGPASNSSFGHKLGAQPSQSSGDLATNSAAKEPPNTKPSTSFGQKLGAQPSQPGGDLSTNTANPAK